MTWVINVGYAIYANTFEKKTDCTLLETWLVLIWLMAADSSVNKYK